MNRRELLAASGIASASTLLSVFGCGTRGGTGTNAPVGAAGSGEVRTWLRDAVARLAVEFPVVHVLGVARRRTTAAIDVLGSTIARARRDGFTIVVRDRDGRWHEHASSDLSADGVVAAVRTLVGPTSMASGRGAGTTPALALPEPLRPQAPDRIADADVRDRVDELAALDELDSRVIYAAAMVDLEDATVWSISPTADREQRLVRVAERVVRAAWNGPRPVVGEAERAWLGGIGDDHQLDASEVRRATRAAMELMTPGTFPDAETVVLLDPTVVATVVDASTRALLTSTAARRPEVKRGVVTGAQVASPMMTLVDDPTVPGAYGGFAFDDEGVPAAKVVLLEGGRIRSRLADRAGGGGRGRRPGHVGPVEPLPSHLVLAPGQTAHAELEEDGFILEGGTTAIVDPSSTRAIVGAARAREVRGGKETGRVFADVELVGELTAILSAVSGVSSDASTISYRDERDGEPRWRSVRAPWLRTRGRVRQRRRV